MNPKQVNFDSHYAALYGERWPALQQALLAPVQHIDYGGYFLDKASVIAAESLPVLPGNAILDLCAAPGGKSLVLAKHLAQGCSLTSNERSATRRARLKTVLDTYVDPRWHSQIQITGHDATKWCLYEKEAYDAILLDAPCSSERHLLHSPHLLSTWSVKRSRQLAVRQYAMLVSALDVLKPGGYVLYATCALSHTENDGVIAKALRKRKHLCAIAPFLTKPPIGEPTQFGWMILPDHTGFGPLYFSLMKKHENKS